MDSPTLIDAIQKKIVEIYREQGLLNLKEYKKDLNLVSEYLSVVRKSSVKYSGDCPNYIYLYEEIAFCSDEIMYFTAHLFFYKPYINNPLEDAVLLGQQTVFPNYQNIAGKRYSMYANVVVEKIYNYWDRIGDLIASFFPDRFRDRKVYFPGTIEAIPKEFRESLHYEWLLEFKNNHYKTLNEARIQTVHYYGMDLQYRTAHLKGASDKETVEKLYNQRLSLPEYYAEHIGYTLEGFEHTIALLDEISKQILSDIPD
jgi:Cthe_2314-like HEPN